MPYDYPGGYAGRFDELPETRTFVFKRIAGQPWLLSPRPPGTIVLEEVVAATPYGNMRLDQWLRVAGPGSTRNVVIEMLDFKGAVVARWKLADAFPQTIPLHRVDDRLMTSIISFELTHRGLFRA